MPIVPTDLTTEGFIASGATVYTTDSITPSANALVLAWVGNEDIFGTPSIPTLTGCGLTWVQIDTVQFGNLRLTLFRALGASPSSGAVTITFPASEWAAIWSITQFTDTDTSGTNGSGAIAQNAQNSDAAVGSSLTVTLGSAIASGNMAAAGWLFAVSDLGMNAGAGWTTIGIAQIPRPTTVLTAYNTTGDETATATTTSGGGRAGMAVELVAVISSLLVFVFDQGEFLADDPPPMPITAVPYETVMVEELIACGIAYPVLVVDSITPTDAATIGLGIAVLVDDQLTPGDFVDSGAITVQPLFIDVSDLEVESEFVVVSRTFTIDVSDAVVPAELVVAALLLELEVSDSAGAVEEVMLGSGSSLSVFDSLTPAGELNVVLVDVSDAVPVGDGAGAAPTFRVSVADLVEAGEVTERAFATHVFLDDLHFINGHSPRRE
jgi:hypothetical protein